MVSFPFHLAWQMRCCGVTDYSDWYPVLGENTVPDRCCMENSQGCGRNSTTLVWKTVRLGAATWGLYASAWPEESCESRGSLQRRRGGD